MAAPFVLPPSLMQLQQQLQQQPRLKLADDTCLSAFNEFLSVNASEYSNASKALDDFSIAMPGCATWVARQKLTPPLSVPTSNVLTARSSSGFSTGEIVIFAGLGLGLLWLVSRQKK